MKAIIAAIGGEIPAEMWVATCDDEDRGLANHADYQSKVAYNRRILNQNAE